MRLTALLLFTLSAWCGTPDRILFSRLDPSEAKLFISDANGGQEHALLNSTSLDYNPAWSPDGRWIAFTSERDGSADLYRVKPDGTSLERLTDNPAYDDQAAFSPDGKQIVFVTTRAGGTADLWILDVATHRARPLTSGPAGTSVPHGRRTENGSRSPPTAGAICPWLRAAGSICNWPISIWSSPMAAN